MVRIVFIIGVLALLAPSQWSFSTGGDSEEVTAFDWVRMVADASGDLGAFCDRQPVACDTADKLFDHAKERVLMISQGVGTWLEADADAAAPALPSIEEAIAGHS